jgi:hypothetical protein
MLKQLENIKNSICKDIDNYHRLEETGEVYQLNGDNIMGIVSYVLTKLKNKILEIFDILLFLKLLYGERVYYNMDISSYMYSTIWGAIEYLESKEFEEIQEKHVKMEKARSSKIIPFEDNVIEVVGEKTSKDFDISITDRTTDRTTATTSKDFGISIITDRTTKIMSQAFF